MIEVTPGQFIPNFQYRYLTEDVPYGLVVTRALGELINVKTPTIDEVISWAQHVMDKVYLIDGRLCGTDIIGSPNSAEPRNPFVEGSHQMV